MKPEELAALLKEKFGAGSSESCSRVIVTSGGSSVRTTGSATRSARTTSIRRSIATCPFSRAPEQKYGSRHCRRFNDLEHGAAAPVHARGLAPGTEDRRRGRSRGDSPHRVSPPVLRKACRECRLPGRDP